MAEDAAEAEFGRRRSNDAIAAAGQIEMMGDQQDANAAITVHPAVAAKAADAISTILNFAARRPSGLSR